MKIQKLLSELKQNERTQNERTLKRFFSSNSKDYNNRYSLKGFDHSESVKFSNLFNNININVKSSMDENLIHYPWEDEYIHSSDDLYNYFYTRFLWDFHIHFESDDLEYSFDKIYIVFYKSDPDDDLELERTDNSLIWYGNKDNILYYETLFTEDINNLRGKFINAYKKNKFDDLHNLIHGFCNEILTNLQEIRFSEGLDLDDLYLNIIVPNNKDMCYSSIKKNSDELPYTFDIGKRFYSTNIPNNIYSYNRKHLQQCYINPLLSSSRIKIKRFREKLNFSHNYSTASPFINSQNLICKNLITQKSFYTTINKVDLSDNIVKDEDVNKTSLEVKNIKNSKIKTSLPKFNFLSCFSSVKQFLDNKPINNKTQKELEQLLYDTCINFNKDIEHNFLSLPSPIREKIFNLLPEWEVYLNNLKTTFKDTRAIKIKKDFDNLTDVDKKKMLFLEIIEYFENLFYKENKIDSVEIFNKLNKGSLNKNYKLKHEKIIGKILLSLLTIIKYSDSEEPNKNNIKTTVISSTISVGKEVVRLYLSELFKEQNKFKSLSSFRDYIIEKDEKYKLLIDENFLSFIGGKLIDILINSGLIDTTIIIKDKKRYSYLVISSKTIMDYKNNTLVTPVKLPMIVKPNDHSKYKLGGYLLNDKLFIDDLITKRPQSKINSQIAKNNCIYRAINGLSSTPFKVNIEVLNFLLENRGEFFSEQLELDDLDQKISLNWRDKRKYKSLLSIKILKENIISIALCYKNIPNFYFPVKLDYRGRIYIIPHYFHLQSHEMAKSLLLFSKPGKIRKNDTSAIEYYKVMAANYFGNGIDKLSFYNKLTWFKENEKDIINFENRVLLNKANKKFLLLAFCIEYKAFANFMKSDDEYFNTHLPLQLDATCNGYQHLSLLAQEKSIYKELNLEKTSKKSKPRDFYNYICTEIILNIKSMLKVEKTNVDINSFERLSKIKLNRSNFKKAIMTKPYNASPLSAMDYIKESFQVKVINNVNWYYNENDDQNMINDKDLGVLYTSFHNYITTHFNRINMLTKYLDQIATICNKLNIPIKWRTPSGLLISQSYLETKEKRFEPFTSRSTTISISITDVNHFNKNKQKTAFLPNFVHSLDGATMALLYKMFSKMTNNGNIAGIHDCFLVTADNASTLLDTLKAVYMKIYIYDEYIIKFDDLFMHNLEYLAKANEYQLDKENRLIITAKGDRYYLPKPINVNIEDYPDLKSSTPAI